MVETGAEPPDSRLTLRDWIAGAALFAATAGVVLWQNAHVAVLFDLSYVLNTAQRIAAGQIPYRDFALPHAPLTFLVQAAMIRLTGRVYFHHVVYAAMVGGLSTVLTWRIALGLLRRRVVAWMVKRAWLVALLLAAPLAVVGIYCILPSPEYDCDCGFWILVAVWALQRIDSSSHLSDKNNNVAKLHPTNEDLSVGAPKVGHPVRYRLRGFVAGVALCVPLFCKQNMGLPFLLAAVCAILLVIVARWMWRGSDQSYWIERQGAMNALAGVAAALAAGALALHWTAGLGNYLHWTIAYAGQRRLPGFSAMLSVYAYPALAWMLPCVIAGMLLLRFGKGVESHPSDKNKNVAWMGHPPPGVAKVRHLHPVWTQVAAFVLLAAPFLFALAALVIYEDADSRGDSFLMVWPVVMLLAAVLAIVNVVRRWRELSLRVLMPIILLAAINGTMMSQQLWGSTYGIWPLLMLLIAELIAGLSEFTTRREVPRRFVPVFAAFISAAMLICGALYTTSEERLSYAYLPEGLSMRSAFPALAGLATPGPYVPEIDELLRYAEKNIPFNDGVVLIPGEEPFFFATGRVPQFPVAFFDPTIDPYSPAETTALVRARSIRWLIVKTDVQTKEDPTPDRAELMRLLMQQFTLAARLRGYDAYRVNAAE
jgi:hypothetical protein